MASQKKQQKKTNPKTKAKKGAGKKTRSGRRPALAGLFEGCFLWLKPVWHISLIIIFSVCFMTWFFFSGTLEKMLSKTRESVMQLTADAGFALEIVTIEGINNIQAEKLRKNLDVDRGLPILSLSLQDIADSIVQMGWVENVRVERRLPHTLYIEIEEREPLAVYKADGNHYLVDGKGHRIEKLSAHSEWHSSLLKIAGEDAEKKASEITGLLKSEQDIFSRVSLARYVGKRRWDLVLKGDMIINLPEADPGLALKKIGDLHKTQFILDKGIHAIDARMQDRLIVKTRPGGVKEYKTSESETAIGEI